MVGRELIEASKLRAQLKQIDEVTIAYQMFKDRYRCIPGDCPNGADFFDTDNGNGNNRLENDYTPNTQGQYSTWIWDMEINQFFPQLSQSGLLKGGYVEAASSNSARLRMNIPEAAGAPGKGFGAASSYMESTGLVCNVFVQSFLRSYDCLDSSRSGISINLYFTMGDIDYPSNRNSHYGLFTPVETFNMDSKIDDGSPHSGRFRASQQHCLGGQPCPVVPASSYCTTSYGPTGGYNTTNSTVDSCIFLWRLEKR